MLLGSIALASTLLTGCSSNSNTTTTPQTTTSYTQYLFNVNYNGGTGSTVTSFMEHTDTGSLSYTTNPTIGAGNAAESFSLTPNGNYAYVNNQADSTVSQYAVSSSYGTLSAVSTPISTSGTYGTGSPIGGAVHPNGGFYYTCNAQDISVFSIGSGGALQYCSNTTATAVGEPQQIVFDSTGYMAFVTGATGVYAFNVSPSTGALTPATVPTYSTAVAMGGMVIDSNKHLYAGGGTTGIYGWTIGSGAILTAVGTEPIVTLPAGSFSGTPTGMTFEPNHAALYVAESGNGCIGAFTVSSSSGILTAVNQQPFAAGPQVGAVAADPTGSYLYSANYSQNKIGGYVIGTGGALTLISDQPYITGTGPVALKLLQFVQYTVNDQ